jgi:hypothetical protein
VLTSGSEYLSFISFSNLPKSLFIFSQFALEYLNNLPNQKQHQQFLDIINDNSLTQVVNKTTRKDKTLDLILTNYPATVNKVETLPPIADHDIVYIECITSLRRCQPKPRKIFKYSKANWENLNKDLGIHLRFPNPYDQG